MPPKAKKLKVEKAVWYSTMELLHTTCPHCKKVFFAGKKEDVSVLEMWRKQKNKS